jgi:glucokinase
MSRLAIALDLGGSQLRAGLIEESGTMLRRNSMPTPANAGPDIVIKAMAGMAKDIAEGIEPHRVAGLGVSSPGPLDTELGLALGLPNLAGFSDFPLRDRLSEATGLSVSLENDGIAAAIGEWKQGSGQGLSHLVYVTVSTGIGGGVIADGRVLRGRRGMAGHIGHMIVIPDGAPCPCGNRGCWEAYACGPAFARRASERLGRQVDAESVFRSAEAGDAPAQALVAEQADILGIGIVSLLHLYSPEMVILGGGLLHGFSLLDAGIRSRISRSAMPAFRDVRVAKAALFPDSGLIGAGMLVFGTSQA